LAKIVRGIRELRIAIFIGYAKNLLIKFTGDIKVTLEPGLPSELETNSEISENKHQASGIFNFDLFPSWNNPKSIKKVMFYNNYFKLIPGTICNGNFK
jgi:hypothetical protein